jgi:DNA polymerase III alpha subunit
VVVAATRYYFDHRARDFYVKILAFSSYGFPESHAISSAYLVDASALLKCYYFGRVHGPLLRPADGFGSRGDPPAV